MSIMRDLKKHITFISDSHYGKNPHIPLSVLVDAHKEAIDYASTSYIPLLCHSGDLFDQPVVGGPELEAFAETAAYAEEKNVIFIIIEGNHGLNKNWASIISHYRHYPFKNVHVVDKDPEIFKLNGVTIVAMPYGKSLDDALALRKKNRGGFGVLLGHEDVLSARYDSGNLSTTGLTHREIETCLMDFDIVALGHIHLPQYIHKSQRAFYVGAPLQFNYRAAGQMDRGFCYYDIERGVLTRHPLVGGKWPRFVQVTLEDCDLNNLEQYKGIHVKLKIQHEDTDYTNDQLVKMFLDAGVKHISPDRRYRPIVVRRRTDIRMTDSPEVMFKKLIKEKFDDPEEIHEYLEINDQILRNIK